MDGGLSQGLGSGLLVAAFWFGFRHGIDWDHIAAITDITSSQDDRREGILFATLYAIGHAAVVMALGIVAIVAGDFLPDSVDVAMGRVVGVTLLLLGVYVVVSLVRHGRDFRLRSRWMLVFSGVRRASRWVRGRLGRPGDPGPAAVAATADVEAPHGWHHGHHGRPGHHHHVEHHVEPAADEPFMNYGVGTSLGVGAIHGIGAETPSQVIIFLTAAGAGGRGAGIAVLAAFIVGLLASNSLIAVGSAYGFLRAQRNFAVYATVAVITAVFSLVLGTLFLLGLEGVLPALFAG